MSTCPLCLSHSIQQREDVPEFFNCSTCHLVFKDTQFLVAPEIEKARYLTHNNDVDDLGYQNFVKPIVKMVSENITLEKIGLDFGAGTGPVITKLLEEKGYHLNLYDPFFHPDSHVLNEKYDYIVCCEVMEHFYHPKKEFQLLFDLLKPNGTLLCMTQLISVYTTFKTWQYRNDKTHVSFYSKKCLQWIKENFGFSSVMIDERLIVFTKE